LFRRRLFEGMPSGQPAAPAAHDRDECNEGVSDYALADDDLRSAVHAELEASSQHAAFASVDTALTEITAARR
jgi:hypothetical protein